MVRVPSLADEDQRRIVREREILVAERIEYINRIKGLCFKVGIRDYKPLHRDIPEKVTLAVAEFTTLRLGISCDLAAIVEMPA
ncbi:MAG: transposase [Sphingomonadales bacterium]|nr:transposase [Sphingomonadales bacterium]MDE2171504.1 transposase [Sphingomonadales bacterium]